MAHEKNPPYPSSRQRPVLGHTAGQVAEGWISGPSLARPPQALFTVQSLEVEEVGSGIGWGVGWGKSGDRGWLGEVPGVLTLTYEKEPAVWGSLTLAIAGK